jgi:hypothetical protein
MPCAKYRFGTLIKRRPLVGPWPRSLERSGGAEDIHFAQMAADDL